MLQNLWNGVDFVHELRIRVGRRAFVVGGLPGFHGATTDGWRAGRASAGHQKEPKAKRSVAKYLAGDIV